MFLIVQWLGAESETDGQVSFSQDIVLQISTLPEAKLGYNAHFRFPFLQGKSPLTADNNIGLDLGAEVSPVSLNTKAEAVWTPIAFFQLAAGGRMGSGWKITLFGADAFGIGINRPDAEGNAEHSGSGFDGLLWKAYAGGAVQFDMAALYPGDWHHLVARSWHEINYRGYTGARAGESWYYENDDGENVNGFNYYGNLLVGYQMPIFLNMAALLAEADLYLYDTPDRARWGDDKIRWTFSAVFNFVVGRQFNIAVIPQFRTVRNYRESGWEDLYYRSRHIDTSSPLHLEFYRVAAAVSYKF